MRRPLAAGLGLLFASYAAVGCPAFNWNYTGTGAGAGGSGGASSSTTTTTTTDDTASTSKGSTSSGTTSTSVTTTSSTSTGSTCSMTMCGSLCTDTSSDPKNCGACGVACPASYTCSAGLCGNVVDDVSTFLATCAVLHGGEVWCWGRDVWGEAGIASSDTGNQNCLNGDRCRPTPRKVDGLPAGDPVVQISAGRQATCALTKAGSVYCWGSNEVGLLGHATTLDTTCTKGTTTNPNSAPCSPAPKQVALPEPATQLSMGTVNGCVLTTSKNVYCWGSNKSGAIQSPPSSTNAYSPVKNANVNGDVDEVVVGTDVSGTYDTVCVRRSATGALACWGASGAGLLFSANSNSACTGGDTRCTPTAAPVLLNTANPGAGSLTADVFTIGVMNGVALQGGKAMAWGGNGYGQMGNSVMGSHFDPLQLMGLPAITAVSAQMLTTVLLDANGDVWTLGWGDEGQLGTGTCTPGTCPINNGQHCAVTPTKVSALSKVIKVRGGGFNSAAITSDHKLWMWGGNYMAPLGHPPGMGDGMCGGYPIDNSPVLVTGLP